MQRRRLVLPAFILLSVLPLAAVAQAPPVDFVSHVGAFGTLDSGPAALEGGVELRLPIRQVELFGRKVAFRFIGGGALTTDDAYVVYGGLRHERELSRHWALGLSFAVSVFEEGNGRNLYGRIEFRSAIDLSVRLPHEVRVGLTLHHMSHAGFYGLNPGSESLLVTIASPLRRLGENGF